jgi:hypothetical protein
VKSVAKFLKEGLVCFNLACYDCHMASDGLCC